MQEFTISIRSFQDILDFVALATVQPFPVLVDNSQSQVNAKSFMGMFSLDYTQPTTVMIDCDSDEFHRFRRDAARFAAS